MPIIRNAKKKLRQDKKRERQNLIVKRKVKEEIKKFKKNPMRKTLPQLFNLLDEASKKKIFHKNKSSRLKSRLSKLIGKKATGTTKAVSTTKKKKPSPKKKIIV